MGYIETVKAFVIENFLFGEDGNLDEGTSFLEAGIIDSTGILELIAFLEEKYAIKVEDDEVLPENLDSLKNVSAYLERKVQGTRSKEQGQRYKEQG